MMMRLVVRSVIAGLLVGGPVAGMSAQQSTAPPSVTSANSSAQPTAPEQLVLSTVHEAWVKSGRNEDRFFDMVKQLAEISAQKRGLTLPDTETAGQQLGSLIKENARRDPDQLLYAVVDAAVKQVGTATVAATK